MIVMGNGNIGSNGVWVETEALLAWKSQMSKLNDDAVETINSIAIDLQSLSDSWKGESATGFETTMDATLKRIINCHNQMGNVENAISTIVTTMENQ